MTSRSSRPLPRLWVIRCHTRAAAASRTGLEPTNSLQPGLQARRQVPELAISFTSPNTHPETATPEDPSQATVATAHTVTGTPSNRYKPNYEARKWDPRWFTRQERLRSARVKILYGPFWLTLGYAAGWRGRGASAGPRASPRTYWPALPRDPRTCAK
jgi:hypothetical protein